MPETDLIFRLSTKKKTTLGYIPQVYSFYMTLKICPCVMIILIKKIRTGFHSIDRVILILPKKKYRSDFYQNRHSRRL